MHKYIYFLLLTFIVNTLEAADVNKIIDSIPLRDRKKIEYLFTFLVQKDTLGYVLFGDNKAMTYASLPITHKEYVMPYKVDQPLRFQKDLKISWNTWKRYEQYFHHPNILVCEEYEHIENEIYLQLFIIDKRKLKNILNKYQSDFQEVLGDEFAPDKFIAKLEKKKKLRPLIKRNDKLLGIMLGFGKESSAAFQNLKNSRDSDPQLEIIGKRPEGCPIVPVRFRGNSSSKEVKSLIDAYDKEIRVIEKIFNSSSFFNITLEKFCAP